MMSSTVCFLLDLEYKAGVPNGETHIEANQKVVAAFIMVMLLLLQ